MKIKIIILILALITLNSCNKNINNKSQKFGKDIESSNIFKQNQNTSFKTIDTKRVISLDIETMIQKMFEEEYISLDTNELIGNIYKILVYKDIIYILDSFVAEKIFIFDMNGKLMKLINSKGQGPEEYVGLADMNLDTIRNELVVSDSKSLHFIHYTLDGKFIRKSRNKPSVEFAILNQNVNLLRMTSGQSYNKNVNFGLIEVKDDSVIRKGFELMPFQSAIPSGNSLFRNSIGNLLFTPVGSDTIYQILNDSTYKVRYIISQKKSVWDYCINKKETLSYENIRDLIINNDYTRFSGNFYETDKIISFDILQKSNSEIKAPLIKNYIYDKQNEELYTLCPIASKDESSVKKLSQIGRILPPSPIAICGNKFISVLQPEYMLAMKQACVNGKLLINNKKFKQIIDQYPVEGNPVLLFYKLK